VKVSKILRDKEEHQAKVSKRLSSIENLGGNVHINRVLERSRENETFSARGNLSSRTNVSMEGVQN
jgi:hypothetical protein